MIPSSEYSPNDNPFLGIYEEEFPGKVHVGDDENASLRSDLGDVVYAVAAGRVTYAGPSPAASRLGYRVHLEHQMPHGSKICSQYFHIQHPTNTNYPFDHANDPGNPNTGEPFAPSFDMTPSCPTAGDGVEENDLVARGQPIGRISTTGRWSSHLHVELRLDWPRCKISAGPSYVYALPDDEANTLILNSRIDPFRYFEEGLMSYVYPLREGWNRIRVNFEGAIERDDIVVVAKSNGSPGNIRKYALAGASQAGIMFDGIYRDGDWALENQQLDSGDYYWVYSYQSEVNLVLYGEVRQDFFYGDRIKFSSSTNVRTSAMIPGDGSNISTTVDTSTVLTVLSDPVRDGTFPSVSDIEDFGYTWFYVTNAPIVGLPISGFAVQNNMRVQHPQSGPPPFEPGTGGCDVGCAIPPFVYTETPTNISSFGATLRGDVTPNGYDTTYYFDIGPDTSYGDIAGLVSVGSGIDPVSVEEDVDDLECETTYHHRLVAFSDNGTEFGNDRVFTTGTCDCTGCGGGGFPPPKPVLQQEPLTCNSQGDAFANLSWSGDEFVFEYDVYRDDHFVVTTSETTWAGDVQQGQSYTFFVRAFNNNGYTDSDPVTVTVPSFACVVPPVVYTDQPTDVTSNNVRFNGRVNPGGEPVTWWFQWGEGTDLDRTTTPLSGGAGTDELPVSFAIATDCGTTYSYRTVAENAGGIAEGSLVSFTSGDCPPDAGPFTLSADLPSCHPDGYPVVDLSWTASQNVFRYHLYRDAQPLSLNLSSATQSFTDGFDPAVEPDLALYPGNSYDYSVVAQSAGGADATSNTVTVTVPLEVCDVTGAPTLTIDAPTGTQEPTQHTYDVGWTADAPDTEARISFYYDTDQSGADGTYIVSGLSEDDPINSFTWHTTFVPEGEYYIYGVIDDGVNPPVTVYSSGTVQVSHQAETTVCGSGCDFADLETAIADVAPGSRLKLSPGIYTTGQVLIDKELTIHGSGIGATVLRPIMDTGTSGDSRGWFVVAPGTPLRLGDVTIDGSGHEIWQGFRHRGTGLFERVHFTDIGYRPTTSYRGTALVAFGAGPVHVLDSSFERMGRVGVLFYDSGVSGSHIRNSTYLGKGVGDWLDYGVEVGAGASVVIAGMHISECTGEASIDGSSSAGILLSTYFGAGTEAKISGNVISNSRAGIVVGINGSDSSTATAHYNTFTGNAMAIRSTGPVVEAQRNFWGHASGPSHSSNPGGSGDPVDDEVLFDPYLTAWSNDVVIQSFSPVDIEVTLAGRTTTKDDLGIPLSVYEEGDFSGDGEINDRITISHAPPGRYEIVVRPDETAIPGDTYSLTLTSGTKTVVVASNALVPLSETRATVRKFPDGNIVVLHDEASPPALVGGFDEGAGTTVDLGGGLTGHLTGGVTWSVGQEGAGLAFNGSGYVLVESSPDSPLNFQEALTIGLWIRPDALGGTQVLVSKDDAYEFEIGKVSDTQYNLRLANAVVGVGETSLIEGQWQHVAVTWDGSTVRYFRNGSVDGEAAYAGVLPMTDADVGIGARPSPTTTGGPTFFFTGGIDGVVLYDRALSAEEIATLVAESVSDLEPPIRSADGVTIVPAGSVEAQLTVHTDEDAVCKYSETPGQDFGSLHSLESSDGLVHTLAVSSLADGDIREFFVRCTDAFGNTNVDELALRLGVGDTTLESGQLLFLPFDSGAGCTAYDLAAFALDGMLAPACPENAPVWSDGILLGALSFAGGFQEVQVAHTSHFDSLPHITISAWVKHAPTTGTYVAIIDKRDAGADGFDLFFEPSSRLFARFNTATATGTQVVADGAWHHVAAVYDGSEIRLYVDGLFDASAPASVGALETTGALHIGRHFAGPDYSFTGTMDEVMVFGRALSDVEILEIFGNE